MAERKSVTPLLKQILVVSSVMLVMINAGMILSYPTSMLPALRSPSSPIKVDLNTSSWLVSCIGFSAAFGFILAFYLMDSWGRRTAHYLGILPGIVGWWLIFFASSYLHLLFGRLLCGLTIALIGSLGPVVVGEYCSPEYRGMFLNLKTTALCVGAMIVHVLQKYLWWKTVALVCVMPLVLAALIVLAWPESPAWLASRKKYKRCKSAFIWLRGESEDSLKELRQLIQAQKNKPDRPKSSYANKIKKFYARLRKKEFLKPLSLLLLGVLLLEMAGRHYFQAYALDIVEHITGNKIQSFYSTIVIDTVIIVSSFLSAILVKFINVRTVLFSTGFAAVVMLILICTYLFIVSLGLIPKDYSIIPVTMLVTYCILVNLGCIPLPLALIGEILPFEDRGLSTAIIGMVGFTFLVVFLKVFPYLLISIKYHGTLALCGIAMSITLLILYKYLPETRNKTLQDIEDHFTGKPTVIDEETLECEDEDVTVAMLN